jgi:hypothetical protein
MTNVPAAAAASAHKTILRRTQKRQTILPGELPIYVGRNPSHVDTLEKAMSRTRTDKLHSPRTVFPRNDDGA